MLKLCIVCNTKVPCSNKFCSCGHVFSPESRRICGKRFSGYRVGMRRQSSGLSERHLNAVKIDHSPKKKKTLMLRTSPKRRSSHLRNKKSKTNSQREKLLKENCSMKKKSERERTSVKPSPQKTLRFSLALAEINRRLCGQTLLWRMLPP